MKKTILLLLISILFSGCLLAQDIVKPGRIFSDVGAPVNGRRINNFTPGRYADTRRDVTTGKMYWASNLWVWTQDTAWGGGTGVNSFTISQCNSVAPGNGCSMTNIGTAQDVNIVANIERGATGATGAAGSGGLGSSWLANVFTGPDKYYATHDSTTIASHGWTADSITVKWPTSGALTTWTVDRAAYQESVNEATLTGRPWRGYGRYYTNGKIIVEKFFTTLEMQGGYLFGTGTTSFTLIERIAPANNTEADIMTNSRFILRDMSFGGNHVHKGVDMGPTYMSRYDNIGCFSLDTSIIMRYELGSLLTNIHVNGNGTCGVYMGIGNYPGASHANSQCNSSILESSRFYSTNTACTPVKIFSCSGIWVRNIIIEGSQCKYGIQFDGNSSTVVHDFNVEGLHFECNPGSGVLAAVKVTMSGGIFNLKGAFGQYAAIMVEASASPGYIGVTIADVYAWVPAAGNFYFKNSGSTSWYLDHDMNFTDTNANIVSRFTGTAVTLGTLGAAQQGANKVVMNPFTVN